MSEADLKFKLVSDDSKMRLIELKKQALLSSLAKIEDAAFQKHLSATEMKFQRPVMQRLMDKYRCDYRQNVDKEKIAQQLEDVLKRKCQHVLSCLIGEVDESDDQLCDKLRAAAVKFSTELEQVSKVNADIEAAGQEFDKLYAEYLELNKKFLEQYKIPFKRHFDQMNCNMLLNKAQAICMRNRLENTNHVLEKYGDANKISTLKSERQRLEKEEKSLKNQLKEAQLQLYKYELVDEKLLSEFKRLKHELEYRKWAIKELDQTSE